MICSSAASSCQTLLFGNNYDACFSLKLRCVVVEQVLNASQQQVAVAINGSMERVYTHNSTLSHLLCNIHVSRFCKVVQKHSTGKAGNSLLIAYFLMDTRATPRISRIQRHIVELQQLEMQR